MKKLLILISMISIFCSGCSTLPESSAELQSKVISWLEDNKPLVKQALVLAGLEIMDRAVSDQERKVIANQMWSISTAYHTLASGGIVTKEKFDETLASFTKNAPSSVTRYAAQASILWSSIYPKLKSSDSAKLAIDYLLIMADAAREVAASYKEPDV